jgi:hypothetical protein
MPFSFSIKPDARRQRPQGSQKHHAPVACQTAFSNPSTTFDHCCYAWNTLIDQPWKIMSIARRDWAVAGHLL